MMIKKKLLIACAMICSYLGSSQTEVVKNGDFSKTCCSNIYWNSTPDMYYNILYSNWHSAPGYAYMSASNGSPGNNLEGYLWQTLTDIPDNVVDGTLTFWYSITTNETTTSKVYDYVDVNLKIDGTSIPIGRISNLDDTNGAYRKYTSGFGSIAPQINNGNNIVLEFHGRTDIGKASTFRIDDVSLLLETSDNNNSDFDLYISSTKLSDDNPKIGDRITLSCRHHFSGSCDCSQLSPNARLGYFLSTNRTLELSQDIQLSSDISDIGDNDPADPESYNWTIPDNISPGDYYILFVTDYEEIHAESNENNNLEYEAITIKDNNQTNEGRITVNLSPADVLNSGAKWKTTNTSVWKDSGETLELPYGDYTLEFTSVSGWVAPNNRAISISSSSPNYTGSFSYSRTGITSTVTVSNSIEDNYLHNSPEKLWSSNNSNSDPVKICADGSRATLIELVSSRTIDNNDIGFELDSNSNNADLYGSFTILDDNVSNMISVRFNHPNYINNLDSGKQYREDIINIIDLSNSEVLHAIPIRIYKAPVLMVHGLWGNVDSFLDLDEYLENTLNTYPDILKERVDYQTSNSVSFEENAPVVPKAIETFISNLREKKYSVGKVNLVCHSMGGILARQYIQSDDFSRRKDVLKLITINSPHSGSPFGNLAYHSLWGLYIRLLANPIVSSVYPGASTSKGAVRDLAIDSRAMIELNINRLNRNTVKSHTITTKVSDFENSLLYPILLMAAETNGLDPAEFVLTFFDYDTHDGVVSTKSQTGGLIGDTTTPSPGFVFHTSAQKNINVMARVNQLLDTSIQSELFAKNFDPEDIRARYQRNTNTSARSISKAGIIKINSPVEDAYFDPGETITIHVTGNNTIDKMFFTGISKIEDSDFQTSIVNGNNFNFTYKIPENAYDSISFIVFGYNSSDEIIDHDIVSIHLNNNSTVSSIEFYKPEILVSDNYVASTGVKAIRSNGIVHDISNHPDLIYEITDNGVAEHYFGAYIKGVAEGTTTLKASFQGMTINQSVKVFPSNGEVLELPILSTQNPEVNKSQEFLSVFPNPSEDLFYLQLTDYSGEKVDINVFDSIGKEVLTRKDEEFTEHTKTLSMKGFRKGLYFLKVSFGNKEQVVKIILK